METSYKAPFFDKYLTEHSDEISLEGMLYGNSSISRRLDKLKSDIRLGRYPELQGNVLLDNVFSRPKTNETELAGPDFLAYKPNKSGDNNLENEVIRAWEELYDNDNKEIRDFARDLAIYSFYTSGDAFGKNNIFRYVPNSIREEIGYFDYIRNLENDPSNAVSQININEVIHNLWWNDHVVPTMEYYRLDSSNETIEDEGRPVYRAQPHEDSGFTVDNDKGKTLDIPGIIYDEASSKNGIVGFNRAGISIFSLYKKVKLDRSSNPKTTFLYKYIGVTSEGVPVYRLINKKGLNYNGNVLVEFGKKRSSIPYNNVVPAGYKILPEEEVTLVTDVTPIKASLQSKIFNESGEFNTDQLAPQPKPIAIVDTDTEPLSYQEWKKDFQSMGEQAAQEAYKQYLDNFEYNSRQQTLELENSVTTAETITSSFVTSNTNVIPLSKKLLNTLGDFIISESTKTDKDVTITKDTYENGYIIQFENKSKDTIKQVYDNNNNKIGDVMFDLSLENKSDFNEFIEIGSRGELLIDDTNITKLFLRTAGITNNTNTEQLVIEPTKDSSTTTSKVINIYAGTGENADLSNFAIRPIDTSKLNYELDIEGKPMYQKLYDTLSDEVFQSVEAAFQAAKMGYTEVYTKETGYYWTDDGIDLHNKLVKASGAEAKKIGRTIKGLDKDAWDADSATIMKFLIKESFKQNPEALQKLLSTGGAVLTHTQDKSKWGTKFPRILMEVREELRNQVGSKKTYTGIINSLEPNQIFVFGSNTQGRHGKGAALTARNKFGAEYGNPEGPQGQSYAIITKDLTKQKHPSRTPEQIKEQIHNLYEYAKQNPDKEFLVAYSGTGSNLNAYSNQEMANMFGSEPIPNNIVFEESFSKLIDSKEQDSVIEKFTKQLPELTELQQYANEVGLTESLPKAEEVQQAAQDAKVVQEKYVYTFSDGYEVSTDFPLNDQQKSALSALESFVKSSDPVITLSGYAGTGKTTIAGIFYEWLKRKIDAPIIFSAPTHRANAVTRQKTPGAKVMTLQSLLGLRPDIDITEVDFNLRSLKFAQAGDIKMPDGSIIFIDESSMIQDSLYDLLQTVAAEKDSQIIYMGDKGQLRPVKSRNISKVFTENEAAQIQLTKVERTGDNPILKESTRVRNGEGLSYKTDINENGQGVQYSSDSSTIRSFVKQMIDETDSSKDPLHFRILAATNDLVYAYNSAYRTLKYGRRPSQIYEGELLMGYANKLFDRNTGTYKLINSGDYIVKTVTPTQLRFNLIKENGESELITMEGYNLTLKDAIDNSANTFNIGIVSNFEENEKIIKVKDHIDYLWGARKRALADGYRDLAAIYLSNINTLNGQINTMKNITDADGNLKIAKSLDYGYAHTIHKSQGGTYSKVLMIDDSIETFGPDSKSNKEVREELRYVAVSRAKNFVLVKTQDNKAIEQAVEESTEEFYDDVIVYATPQMIRNIASEDAVSELSNLGQQRKNECK